MQLIGVCDLKIDGSPVIKVTVPASDVDNFAMAYRESRVWLSTRVVLTCGEIPGLRLTGQLRRHEDVMQLMGN
jgi:hypothetical protein